MKTCRASIFFMVIFSVVVFTGCDGPFGYGNNGGYNNGGYGNGGYNNGGYNNGGYGNQQRDIDQARRERRELER